EERRHLVGRQQPADMEALHLVAVVGLQKLPLPLGLHALRGDLQIQTVTEPDQCFHHTRPGSIRENVADERLIDLESGDREPEEPSKRRVRSSEIVDRESGAEVDEAPQLCDDRWCTTEDDALRQFELQCVRIEARVTQSRLDETRMMKLARGKVDGHAVEDA